jgi:predicted transcriptional regulator
MILPCEVAVKSVIPAVKALIAQGLMEERGMKQGEVADILGISQSAVSKYSRKVRGYAVKLDALEEIQPFIDNMIIMITNRTYERPAFLQLFCQTCIAVRKTNVMCPFCRKSDPKIKIEECGFCKIPKIEQK